MLISHVTVESDMLDLVDTTLHPAARTWGTLISAMMDAFVTSYRNTAGHGPLAL